MSDDGTTAGGDQLTEALLAQINPPPDTDLASVIGRLNDVSEQLQQITADVIAHGAPIGRVAVGLIGNYSMAWGRLADGVRHVAELDGLINARQLLDAMQELHDKFELQTRPPKDRTETTDGS